VQGAAFFNVVVALIVFDMLPFGIPFPVWRNATIHDPILAFSITQAPDSMITRFRIQLPNTSAPYPHNLPSAKAERGIFV
jgi:hypothetical protein